MLHCVSPQMCQVVFLPFVLLAAAVNPACWKPYLLPRELFNRGSLMLNPFFFCFPFHCRTLINHLIATRFSLAPPIAHGNKPKETWGKCESLMCSLLLLVLMASEAFLAVEIQPGTEVSLTSGKESLVFGDIWCNWKKKSLIEGTTLHVVSSILAVS